MVAAKRRSGNTHLRRFRNDHSFVKLLCTLDAGIAQYFDLISCICGFG
jgi:hypothetical protein